MAVIFCNSAAADDTADGSTWALAKKSLQAAVTAAGNGGTVYLADTHSETIAANYTITCPAATNLPVKVITSDVLTGTSVSYVKASTPQLITSGGSYDISVDGTATFIGVSFSVGDDFLCLAANAEVQRFIDCTIKLASVGSSLVSHAASDGFVDFSGVEFKFNQVSGLANQPIRFSVTESAGRLSGCTFTEESGALTNFTSGLILLGDNVNIEISACDFSGFTGLSELVTRDTNTLNTVSIDGCKMPSGVPIFSTATYSDFRGALATRCDGNNFGILHDSYWGQLTDADKTRTGGASDGDAFAWKVVTTANCSIANPYYTQWMPIWVSSTGSKTFTVYIGNAAADLTDTQCWLEVEYLGTASSTLPSTATNRNADILAAGTVHTDDTGSTWSGGGLTYMQSLAKTVTIAKAGLAQVRVVFIKPSATVYIDPLVTVS